MSDKAMVRWAFNFASWNPTRAELLTATSCIQQEEKDRIAKFVFLRDFKASLVGRLLMRKFVHDYTGVAYNEIRFIRDERGKPLLTFPENSELKFNVSHHGSFCVLAGHIGSSLLGVDVMKFERERHKDLDEYFRIMSRQFTRDEWDTITRSPQKYDQITMFYRHWSLKESYVKAVGVGITERLQNLSFKINTDKLNKVQITADTELHIYGEKANWFFEEMLLDDDHCVAVALDNKEFLQNYDAELLIKLQEHLISAKKAAEEAVEKAAGQTDVLDDNKRFGTLLCLNDSLMMQKDYLTSELNKLQKIKEKQQEEILSLLKERNEWQNMKIELQRKIENCVCETTTGHLASTDAESEGSLETCQNLQKRFKKNSFSKMQIKMEKLQIKIEQLESDLESEKQNCKMLELRMREKCIASTTEPVTSTEGNGTVHLELQQMQTYYETLLARKAKEYSDSYKKLDENNVKLYQQNIELNDRLEQLLEQTLLNETQNKLHCLQPTSSEINKINWKLHRSNSKLAMVLEDVEALNSHMMESSHLQSAGDILSDWRISAKDMELDVSLATEFETLSNLAHYTEVLADLVCLYIVHLRKASKMDISGSSERGLCRSGKKFTLKPPTLVLPMSPDSPAETQKAHKFAEFPTSVKQNSVDQMHSVFEDNRAFPSLPDDLLKNLGLLGENSCQDWTEEEMEQKFAVLMMSFKIDMSTIKYRFTKVTQDLQQKQYYISNEMQELLSLINKQMTDIVAVKAKMEGIMDAFSVVSTLTQLCGAIQEEKRVIKAFTMVHNYILMLRQRTGNRHQPIECVRCCQKQEEYKPTARTTNCVKKLSSGLLFVLSALGLVVIANILLKVCTHAGLLSSRYFWDDSLWEEIFAPIQVYKTKEGVPPH